MWTGVLLLSLVAAAPSAGARTQTAPADACATWQACQAAVEAALAADAFERAHDLAWRALQKGPKDDPALMFLLARAQARAGRPQDALVMTRRLAERGIPTDAATHPDLERMRSLPAWPEVEAIVARGNAGVPTPPADPVPRPVSGPAPVVSGPGGPASAARASDAPAGAPAGGPLLDTAALTEEALRFSTDRFVPAGLAYDAVSRRFVMGDRLNRKLRVVGEGLDHAVDLVRSESAGFLDVQALAIDARRGDLWVVTSDAAGDSGTLHRLQLVSGRPLQSIPLTADANRLLHPVDLAVAQSGMVFILDRDGRILRARPGGTTIETVLELSGLSPVLSLALAARDTVAYVSHAGGLTRADLERRTTAEVKAPGLPLTAIACLRAHRDGFVALQRGPDGAHRLLRLQLSRNGRGIGSATTFDVRVDAGGSAPSLAVSGDEVALMSGGSSASGDATVSPSAIGSPAELVVRRFRLR